MRYWSGECRFRDFRFEVLPHTLRVYRPTKTCPGSAQPQMDFSKGFPSPWRYTFTDISIPSQHTFEGKSFAAEVTMSHTYSIAVDDKLVSVMVGMSTDTGR
jgi:hypothetical protein